MKSYPSDLIRKASGFEVINGHGAVDKYLHRWRLLALPNGRRLYLHHFIGSDWSIDLHDHPKRFVSIGLFGGYVEEYVETWNMTRGSGVLERNPSRIARRRYVAPWVRTFGPTHAHRLRVPKGGCWTLVWVGREKREWGFWRSARWWPWDSYVNRFGGRA